VGDPQLRVECYSGYRAEQRPLRVHFPGRVAEVAAVEDRWYSPGFTYFRVLMTDGERYILGHQEPQDVWTLEAFRAPQAPHTSFDTKVNRGV
jgi:hypothetical protein